MGWFEQKQIDCEEWGLAGLTKLARRKGPERELPAHLITGIDGEMAALFHLRRNGCIVVARRWSPGDVPGDVDLIVWQGPILCFVEVKTRTARDASPAEIAVDWHKRNVLRRLARRYIRQLPQQTAPPIRFDVISVYLVPGKETEFVHFEGAFGWDEREEFEEW
ncbi:MAG: YraN family protein [Terracidiphilus sp.]|jgi:putative endonuclease